MKRNSKIPFRPSSLNTGKSITAELFSTFSTPDDALANLSRFILKKGPSLSYLEYDEVAENIWIHRSATLSSSVKIDAPAIICRGASIGHCAHIRSTVVGSFAIIGDNSQITGSIILDKARLNYSNVVCGSIVGNGAQLSSGVSVCEDKLSLPCANLKGGAIICDFARIGANSVIGSGILIDEYSTVPPLSTVSHDVKAFSVFKGK